MKFWDLLYQRYGNPLDLMQQMINSGQFDRFIFDVVTTVSTERNERTSWEYYLHSGIAMHGMSFKEFLGGKKEQEDPEEVDMDEIEATVKESMNILDTFKP